MQAARIARCHSGVQEIHSHERSEICCEEQGRASIGQRDRMIQIPPGFF